MAAGRLDSPRSAGWHSAALPLALLVQASLLFYNLDLLPMWGDEVFTVHVVGRPWDRVPEILHRDIHPPLYYALAKIWAALPLPAEPVIALRMMSAIFCLASTIVIDRLWLRNTEHPRRACFLALWAVSPALILYSRMARSYSLQLLVSAVALRCGWDLVANPTSRRHRLFFGVSGAVLLYTHYLPGIAISGAVGIVLAIRWLRSRDGAILRGTVISYLLMALLYLPWLATFAYAISRVSRAEPYVLFDDTLLETMVKLSFWFTSFSFGESFPTWAIFLGLAAAPPLIWLVWLGIRREGNWIAIPALAGAIGYFGAAAWVSFPFVGARMLFLLPFYLLCLASGITAQRRPGAAVLAGILAVQAGALSSYYRKQGFLNAGYTLPSPEIVDTMRTTPPAETLILLDSYNTDAEPIVRALGGGARIVRIRSAHEAERARSEAAKQDWNTIWFLRSTHDTSPGKSLTALQKELKQHYPEQLTPLVPYSDADRWAAGILGWDTASGHHYVLLEFRRAP